MYCQSCGNNSSRDFRFCHNCGMALNTPSKAGVESIQGYTGRFHGLDVLRGLAMMLGIVLHAALPYIPDVEAFWPADESSSHVTNIIFQFIHIWRMPLFFILAGFFANLFISNKSWKSWWGNRLLRIGLPLMVFSPLMSLTLPWIFKYGATGEFVLFYSDEGQPFHLWFLWHLIIFVILTVLFRPIHLLSAGLPNRLIRIGIGFVGCVSRIVFRPRFPIVFIIICCFINLPTRGELILNPMGSGGYFVLGYSLYKNPRLFMFVKAHWKYYLLAGLLGFTLYMLLNVADTKHFPTYIYGGGITSVIDKNISKLVGLLEYLFKIICAVLFSYAFIGIAESRFRSYNAKWRFVSDGAYWIYLIHLPIVTLITFAMFDLQIFVEIKFLAAIIITSLICIVTYKYCVRSTPIGILLNGRRYPFRTPRS